MRPIPNTHIAERGLVVDVTADDDQTAFAVQELLAGRWATAEAGVRRANPAYGCGSSWTSPRTPERSSSLCAGLPRAGRRNGS
ncbi:DUF6207 family protein [Streptomyces sp. NPDC050549]|uniref:DUF6207 family protein n=1 Tax=Streptomyces sp. NPDC050549 TaxID=3155406 RepID=UPI0034327BF4